MRSIPTSTAGIPIPAAPLSRALGRLCASLALAVSSLVLGAWLLRPLLPIDGSPLWLMKANTALGVLGVSLAMLLLDARGDGARRLRVALGASVAALCAVILVQWAAGHDLGVDQLLAADPSAHFPGRTSPWTAAMLGSLALGSAAHGARRFDPLADAALVAAGVVLQLTLAGYLYGVIALYGVDPLTRVSPQTLACLLALWVAGIVGRLGTGLLEIATRRSPGGSAVRLLVPVALVLPVLLGWARLLAQSAGLFGSTQLGVAVFAVTQTLILVALVLWFGRRLDASESRYVAERERREELEQFVAICAWTGQVRWHGRWIRVEQYLAERWGVQVTHGISDEGMRQLEGEVAARRTEASSRGRAGEPQVDADAPPRAAGADLEPPAELRRAARQVGKPAPAAGR